MYVHLYYVLCIKSSRKRSDLDDADDIDNDDLGDGSGNSEDKIRLLRPEEDLETGLGQDINISIHQPPPPYVGRVEALQYSLSRLEGKISELDSAHKAYLARPTLDDNPKEEELIKQLTKDLSEVCIIFLFNTFCNIIETSAILTTI